MDYNVKMKYFFKASILVLLLSALAFSSCRKSGDLHWDTDVLVPLLHSSLDVWDIMGDTNLVENPDQSMSVVVDDKIELLDPDKVIEVYDTLAVDIFNIPLYLQYAPGDQVTKSESSVTMDLGDMELSFARARVAVMKFYVTNTIKQPLRVKYELLSSNKDGKSFEIIEDVPAAGSSGSSYSIKTIQLDDYDMDMTGDGTQVNTVVSRTTVWLHPDADSIWITPADTVLIISTFEDLKVDYVQGYFGKKDYIGKGSSSINMFGNFKSGSFDLDKVNARLKIRNYVGMDVQLKLNKLSSYNNRLHKELALNHPIIGSQLNIARAKENGSTIEDVKPTEESYSILGSNLDALIENMPDSLLFDISAHINPLGNVSSGNDFLYFEKGIEASIEMEIPLKFSANNLMIEDYSSLNFDDKGKLKSGLLNVQFLNSFPFDLDLQFYVLNKEKQIVDSLFSNPETILSGTVDSQGYVSAPKFRKLIIPLTKAKIELLRSSSDLLIRARVNSFENRSLRLFQNNNLDIQIVGDLKYEL